MRATPEAVAKFAKSHEGMPRHCLPIENKGNSSQ